jgi:hypothetical protein
MISKTTIGPATKIGGQETRNYRQIFLNRAAEKNNRAIIKNMKQFRPWFKECGARVKYYQLGKSATEAAIDSAKGGTMDFLDSISNTISTAEDDEEVGMEVEYYRDHKHCKEEVYSKMTQEESIEALGNESFGLAIQGRDLSQAGSAPLRSIRSHVNCRNHALK